MSGKLRYAFLIVPALLWAVPAQRHPSIGHDAAGAQGRVDDRATASGLRASHPEPGARRLSAFDALLAVPPGIERRENDTFRGPREPDQRRRHDRDREPHALSSASLQSSTGEAARARTLDRIRIDFAALRHAERANRQIFGSTAPPALL